MVHIGNSWDSVLEAEFKSEFYLALREKLKAEYAHYTVYPPAADIFNALRFTPFELVKAVVIGQDPYHNPEQAHGLSFSVRRGIQPPPSLLNIYKELQSDLGIEVDRNCGDLTAWANRGVLLLNAALTVRAGAPMSHGKLGWSELTDSIIKKLNERTQPVVFILWGGFARGKKALITAPQHCVIESAHPSPLSAHNGFFGSKPFSRANAFLEAHGIEAIDWSLPAEND